MGKGGIGGIIGKVLDPINIFGLQKTKAPEVAPSPATTTTTTLPQTPSEADASVSLAAAEERRKRQAAMGTSSTLLTGGTGVQKTATTQKKTLLGG